ncbi:glycoside hydrolase family 31 protein [Clostridium perfringens]|uniref:glycoside hydrolase family 31 protein n=1 Tax=Clostridium perfringens TaxID=1502 RepID=UPI001094B1BA|nr:glycoside hydrolase family 31 protein [Clostridium perfringens]TGY45783.1 glycoside hydrolase [Clostridium perfringens]
MGKLKSYIFKMYESEYWYGPVVNDGIKYPLNFNSKYEVDVYPNKSPNQVNTILLSNKGRYIWCDSGFVLKVYSGVIEILSEKSVPQLYEKGGTLKEAFLHAANKFFKPNGKVPPKSFFTKPQYNTWIELLYDQREEKILEYANSIVENGMPEGIIMIDDGWSDYYGRWKFNGEKFKNPKGMINKLHELGFKVMLWTCPFITPDTQEFRYLRDRECLVKNKDGSVSIKKWWNGYSAVLDLTNPEAVKWYLDQNDFLIEEYGVDGFKFDAGDASFYSNDDLTYKKIEANEHSKLWALLGLNYEFNEFRACFQCAGLPLVQRLADKNHSWEYNGVSSLIPNQLAQGILGYSYTCPDMIGGGEYLNFLENSSNLDEELFVRYAQCAALMPMMQFSAAPWRVLSKENFEICKKAAWEHVKYSEYIYELAEESSRSGEPIVRYMEYEFPNENLEGIKDQFMLGEKYMIAPNIKKGARKRMVNFPRGKWKYKNDEFIIGPRIKEFNSPLEEILIFERVN